MAVGFRQVISNHQTVKDWAMRQDGEFTRHDIVAAGLAPNIRTAGLIMNKLAAEGLEFGTRHSGGHFVHYDMTGKPKKTSKRKVSAATLARLEEWVKLVGVFSVADVEAAELKGLTQRSSILPAIRELSKRVGMSSERDGSRIVYTLDGYEAPEGAQMGSWDWVFERMGGC